MSQQEIESLFGDKPVDTSAAVPSEGKSVTDVFAEGSKSEAPTIASTLMQPFHGFNVGLANVIGAPVDLVNWSMKQAGLPVSEKPFLGSGYVAERMGEAGVTPEKFPPKNLTERMLRAGGEGVAYAVAPQAGVEVAGMRAAGIPLRELYGAPKGPFVQPTKPPTGVTFGETAEKVFGARKDLLLQQAKTSLPILAVALALSSQWRTCQTLGSLLLA